MGACERIKAHGPLVKTTCMFLVFQLGIMDTVVSRNFFGRQVNSFEASVQIKDDDMKMCCSNSSSGSEQFHGVFIRAPAVIEVKSPDVRVLARLDRPELGDSVIVAVQQDRAITTSFHPELTPDLRWHLYFLNTIARNKCKD